MSRKKTPPTWRLYAIFIIAGLIALAFCVAMYLLPVQ